MNDRNGSTDVARKWKAVYTIIEKDGANGAEGRKFFCRIGTAWVNRDDSLNVRLDAMPVNGTLHIRDPQPDDSGVARPGGATRERALAE